MADYREARPSTDEESAPLLDDAHGQQQGHNPHHPSFSERLGSIVHEPLTLLNKILLVLLLALLILSSVFIGLFAGAQHKLHTPHNEPGGQEPPTTVTNTVTVPTTTTAVTTTTIVPAPAPSLPPKEPVCMTPDCVVLSAAILSSLDTTQDPCDNFYDYATGGWRKSHPIPSDKGSFATFTSLFQENQQIVRDILENEQSAFTVGFTSSYDEQVLTKLRDLYSSCLDEDTLDQFGEGPLKDFARTVKKLFRGETTDIDAKEPRNDVQNGRDGLTAAISYLHSRGIPGLFDISVEGDAAVDPNFMVLWFSQPRFGLPSKEYYDDESARKIYQEVVENLLLVLYEEEEELRREATQNLILNEESVIHKLAKRVVKFERRLANASLDLDILLQDPIGTYNKVPISNITSTLPQINFNDYFATFTPRNYPDEIIITYPAYTRSLAHILNTTSSDVVEAYLVIQAALVLAPRLGASTDLWKAERRLYEVLQGIKPGAVGDRAEFCVDNVDRALGFATGRYFVNETFGGDAKEKGTKVITDIVTAFKASLSNIAWMDKESADAAAAKADAIRVKVGYPESPDTRSAESIARYYSLVRVDKHTFFDNMLSSSASDVYKAWQQLGKQRDPGAWEMSPPTVNAYYNPPGNEIVFPAGILRPPFFSKDWPSYLKYGAFGQVAAHELTHAFDSAGRLYNQEGKLEEWWTNATSDGFQVKQDCIVNQFSSYTIDDGKGNSVHLNGNLTSGENIGDSGIIQAYRAWQAQFEESYKEGNEYLLPGLNFTRDQLFFLSFGRIWAQNIKPASLLQRVRTDPHSPNNYRVEGTLYNVPAFAKAFNCSSKAKLNPPPEKQCLFW
ncbi:metallo peptidase M13 [Heterobasidion irregulare TC 32-1]|uniref:Metallo peptidase M13 n=1 Tax=Heterobasidion irregulare (strain TC 32-1) TaxID=747525 RepID=W4KK87_HETIT|nr:metallo peptidase M13 [Heterobasidion irregulare TC 32-1]ETW85740.1 metallo peptidase M13 [Heterobasidion irregulare TC 32-1]